VIGMSSLFSLPEGLQVERIELQGNLIALAIVSALPSFCCPLCSQASSQVHSWYQRTLRDVPCAGREAVLATWIIHSKTSPTKPEKIPFPCLQTEAGWCTLRSQHPHPHARTTIFLCDGDTLVMAGILTHLRRLKNSCWDALSSRFIRWTEPLGTSLPLAILTDLG
jgi:hypothetical protein